MRGLSPNFHIHVSVSDLYTPRIGPHIFLQQKRQTDRGNIYFAHRHMNVEIGTETPIFLFWEYLFRKSGILSLQCSLEKCYQLGNGYWADKQMEFRTRWRNSLGSSGQTRPPTNQDSGTAANTANQLWRKGIGHLLITNEVRRSLTCRHVVTYILVVDRNGWGLGGHWPL